MVAMLLCTHFKPPNLTSLYNVLDETGSEPPFYIIPTQDTRGTETIRVCVEVILCHLFFLNTPFELSKASLYIDYVKEYNN